MTLEHWVENKVLVNGMIFANNNNMPVQNVNMGVSDGIMLFALLRKVYLVALKI